MKENRRNYQVDGFVVVKYGVQQYTGKICSSKRNILCIYNGEKCKFRGSSDIEDTPDIDPKKF